MARPKRESAPLTIKLANNVLEVLDQDCNRFGISKGAYISQLIMQKHLEMVATGLLEKMSPEQIQLALDEQRQKSTVKQDVESDIV